MERMKEAGSLDYIFGILQTLHKAIQAEINQLEDVFGKSNFELRLILNLKV